MHHPIASDLIEGLSTPARLALAYAPRRAKREWLAFLALHERLSQIAREAREPLMAQIRLAWWRERLSEPPQRWRGGEPLLDALRAWPAPARLASLPDGWEPLLAERLTDTAFDDAVGARAQACLGLAEALGQGAEMRATERAGRIWAAADLVASIANPDDRARLRNLAADFPPPTSLPAALRPLAVLGKLGAASIARGGGPLLAGPQSLLLALRVGLTGR